MFVKKRKRPDLNRKNKNSKKEEIGALAKNTWFSWKDNVVLVSKTKIRTWKAIFIVAFATGTVAAIIFAISLNIQSRSGAGNGADLTISMDDDEGIVTLENGSDEVNIDILLNSYDNNVVTVRAEVNYDPEHFEFQSWDTSNSVFAVNNNCVYNNKPCEIVNNNPANGKISITLAKPSPGVNVSSGLIAALKFKALKAINPSSPNFTLSYSSGSYEDSDVIVDDGAGTDILNSVTNATISVYTATCTDFNYTQWGACQNKTQTRVVVSGIPEGCGGGTPELSQVCDSKDEVPCISFTYSDWSACQSNGTQSRTVTTYNPSGCSGGETPILTQSCEYAPSIISSSSCISFTYSDWSACQSNGTQSRTVSEYNPSNCSGGETPILTQSCEYKEEKKEKKEEKKDKEDPKIKDLPKFLRKHAGEKIWWKGTDNKGIDYYTYNFNGKKVKTHRKHFYIPASTRKGVYLLRVKAYDKAGNSSSRLVTIVIH